MGAGSAASAHPATSQTGNLEPWEAQPTESGVLAGAGGLLSVSIVANPAGSINVANRELWVLKKGPRQALIAAGMLDNASGNALQNWIRACRARAPTFQKVGYRRSDRRRKRGHHHYLLFHGQP